MAKQCRTHLWQDKSLKIPSSSSTILDQTVVVDDAKNQGTRSVFKGLEGKERLKNGSIHMNLISQFKRLWYSPWQTGQDVKGRSPLHRTMLYTLKLEICLWPFTIYPRVKENTIVRFPCGMSHTSSGSRVGCFIRLPLWGLAKRKRRDLCMSWCNIIHRRSRKGRNGNVTSKHPNQPISFIFRSNGGQDPGLQKS